MKQTIKRKTITKVDTSCRSQIKILGEAKMFKELVRRLVLSNKSDDHSEIWNAFCKENISHEIVSRNTSFRQYTLPENESDILKNENLPEEFWQKLFLGLRDQGCKNVTIETEQVVNIRIAGIERELTLENLDQNVLEDYGDLLTTQTAIPDIMIPQDDKSLLKDELREKYENLKRKHDNEQARKAFFSTLINSPEAKRLQNLQSQEAEFYVQDQLIKLWRKLNIPGVILRGVQTYENVGRHLSEFGIKLSKLR